MVECVSSGVAEDYSTQAPLGRMAVNWHWTVYHGRPAFHYWKELASAAAARRLQPWTAWTQRKFVSLRDDVRTGPVSPVRTSSNARVHRYIKSVQSVRLLSVHRFIQLLLQISICPRQTNCLIFRPRTVHSRCRNSKYLLSSSPSVSAPTESPLRPSLGESAFHYALFFPFSFDIIITQVIKTWEDKVLYRLCLTVSIWCLCLCSGTPRQARCAAWRLWLQPPRRAGPEHLVGEKVHDSSCNHRVKSLHLRCSLVIPFAVVITHSALLTGLSAATVKWENSAVYWCMAERWLSASPSESESW